LLGLQKNTKFIAEVKVIFLIFFLISSVFLVYFGGAFLRMIKLDTVFQLHSGNRHVFLMHSGSVFHILNMVKSGNKNIEFPVYSGNIDEK